MALVLPAGPESPRLPVLVAYGVLAGSSSAPLRVAAGALVPASGAFADNVARVPEIPVVALRVEGPPLEARSRETPLEVPNAAPVALALMVVEAGAAAAYQRGCFVDDGAARAISPAGAHPVGDGADGPCVAEAADVP